MNMFATTWDQIVNKISGYPDGPLKEKYIACASFLSSNKRVRDWFCELDVYGRLLVSPHPDVWPVTESHRSILIGLPLEDSTLPARLIAGPHPFETAVETEVTVENCGFELDRLVEELLRP